MSNLSINPGRVLIIQTAFIGDVLLTLPMVQKLKELFPAAALDFLAIPPAKNILETVPEISRLLIYDKRGKDRGVRNLWRLIGRIKRRQYKVAIVPHRSIRSALMVRAAGIPRRIGFDRSAGRRLFTDIIPYDYDAHEINRNLYLLSVFGADPGEIVYPRLHFTESDERTVRRWLENTAIQPHQRIICIAPGSVWATKRWLPENFAALADTLNNEGFQIVLVGGEQDKAVARQMLAAMEGTPANAIGEFTVRQSACLISNALMLITNDSAPMHMAVATATPVISIFGATVPQLGFYPYGPHDRVVENHQLLCRPCGSHGGHKCPIGTFECMISIRPESVLREVEALLNMVDNEKTND